MSKAPRGRGLLITLEGIDGSGKSSAGKTLAQAIRFSGQSVTETRCPGGTAMGSRVRQWVTDPYCNLANSTTFLLFMADLVETAENVIAPALERGDVVICDRFMDSMLAYHDRHRGLATSLLGEFARNFTPDITLLFDLDPEIALARVSERNTPDRFEARPLEYHEDVRRRFKGLSFNNRNRFITIDAAKNIKSVHNEVIRKIKELA